MIYGYLTRNLEHFGATLADVVRETIYVTDIDEARKLVEYRKLIYGGRRFPAITVVQVAQLWDPEALLEIELVVAMPNK